MKKFSWCYELQKNKNKFGNISLGYYYKPDAYHWRVFFLFYVKRKKLIKPIVVSHNPNTL